nr:carbon monoxide dehydrogenase subunit G [Actibacterium sp. MT2.3-13A]
MTGHHDIDAAPMTVWNALNTPDVLARILPGCDHLEETGADRFEATATVRVGPINARFRGKVRLSEKRPPSAFRIEGEGAGGAAGMARGQAAITLDPLDGGRATRLTYDADVEIGGKMASLGGRLVEAVSKRNIDNMMAALSAEVARGGATAAQTPVPALPQGGDIPEKLLFHARLQSGLLALILGIVTLMAFA